MKSERKWDFYEALYGRNADSGDDVGFVMAPPPTSGLYKTRRNPLCRVVVCVRCGCLHAECSCYLTPPTSCLNGPPPVPCLCPCEIASCFSNKPPAWSCLLLHPGPLDSSLLRSSSSGSEHDLHTCGCGQSDVAIVGCRTTEHPSLETPRYREL